MRCMRIKARKKTKEVRFGRARAHTEPQHPLVNYFAAAELKTNTEHKICICACRGLTFVYEEKIFIYNGIDR